jgi:hypothetical protein
MRFALEPPVTPVAGLLYLRRDRRHRGRRAVARDDLVVTSDRADIAHIASALNTSVEILDI